MRLGRLALLIAALCLLAPAAFAQCEMCGVENPDPDTSWDWDDPLMEESNPTGPIIYRCVAVASNSQACKSCEPAYSVTGHYKGYDVCAFVTRSASCRCRNANTSTCSGEGSCTYYP